MSQSTRVSIVTYTDVRDSKMFQFAIWSLLEKWKISTFSAFWSPYLIYLSRGNFCWFIIMEASRDSSSPDKETDFNASASSKKAYEFDDLLRLVGGFGRYQMMLYGFMCLMTVPIGLQQLVLVFYGASPSFQCAEPSTAAINNNSLCPVDQCCANCTKYEFNGKFTSAVSEVRFNTDFF